MFKSKKAKLIFGILFDLLGMASYIIPGLGETIDIGWAPIAGFLMTRMYPGKTGIAAGVIATVEELLPGADFIPTFTITWLYVYLIKKEDQNRMPSND